MSLKDDKRELARIKFAQINATYRKGFWSEWDDEDQALVDQEHEILRRMSDLGEE